jgi:hypothetical protein
MLALTLYAPEYFILKKTTNKAENSRKTKFHAG